MTSNLFFTKSNLSYALRSAAENTYLSTASGSSFETELNNSLLSFATNLPQTLVSDRVCTHTAIPFERKIKVASNRRGSTEGELKPRHPLIKEVRNGNIVLSQPVKWRVREGDNLWRFTRSLTSGKASISDLKKWNRLSGDTIHPGQELWLCNPDDELIREVVRNGSRSELFAKNPSFPMEKLNHIATKYVGLKREEYFISVSLKFKGNIEDHIAPQLLTQNQQQSRQEREGHQFPTLANHGLIRQKTPTNEPTPPFAPQSTDWLQKGDARLSSDDSTFYSSVFGSTFHGFSTYKEVPQPPVEPATSWQEEAWEIAVGCIVTTGDFLNGAANAVSHNNTTIPSVYGGTVSIVARQRPYNEAFYRGQQFGDIFSMVQGTIEGVAGAVIAVAGGAGAVVSSPTGIGAVALGSLSVGGVAISGHGINTALTGFNNLLNNEKPKNLNSEGVKKERTTTSPEKDLDYPEGVLGKGDGNNGPKGAKDLVGFRKDHILNRHRSGAGKAGKTEFPVDWSDDKIIYEVNKIANNPNAPGGVGKWDSPYKTGIVEGIEIRVDFYPKTHPQNAGKVSTAYPTNTILNPN